MKLTKAQIKGKQEELGRAQAHAYPGGGAALPLGVGRCYPPTSTLQPPGVFRPRPPGVFNQGATTTKTKWKIARASRAFSCPKPWHDDFWYNRDV